MTNYIKILEDDKTFNERLKGLRILHGLTQPELGNKIGASKQAICNWENDNIIPSVDMICKLADTFNCSCDFLLCKTKKYTFEVNNLNKEQIKAINLIIDEFKLANKALNKALNKIESIEKENTNNNDEDNKVIIK